jgi:hypothetical protein
MTVRPAETFSKRLKGIMLGVSASEELGEWLR